MKNSKSMDIKIEKGIPVPPRSGSGGRPLKYPWDKMAKGESVMVSTASGAYSGKSYGRRHGLSFVARKIGSGYRVWRVK